MWQRSTKTTGDPLAQRVARRTRQWERREERRRAYWDGLRSGDGDAREAIFALVIGAIVYIIAITVVAVYEELRDRIGKRKRPRGRRRPSRATVYFHEV